MASTRDITRRIKSIKNTKKITRAMEMVSAAKMRRAVASVLAIRPYAHSAWSVLTNLARSLKDHQTGLLEVRPVKSVLVVVVSSNKGLCGPFNSQLSKKIREELRHPERLKVNLSGDKRIASDISDQDLKIDFITIGKKGDAMIGKLGKDIIASFIDLCALPSVEDVRPLVKIILDAYQAKKYDKVVVAYTDYISAISQQTKIRQILPISKIDLEKQIAEIDVHAQELGLEKPKSEYKVEPSPEMVLEHIVPRLMEMQIFHAVLESKASEESARMLAMRNATDAAGEMAADLTFAFNQLRQGKITQEISEISAGRAALEN